MPHEDNCMGEAYRVEPVTAEVVVDWALGTLHEWLPGYTFPDGTTQTEQYRVRHLADDSFLVETLDAHAARRFGIELVVTELDT